MKWLLALAVLVLILIAYWIASYGDWHVKRNRRNILPQGKLSRAGDQYYLDERGIIWEVQPASKNVFHQPDITPVPPGVPIPYPNVDPPPRYDPDHPNLKFLSREKGRGSYEAILQPDGSYLTEGKKQGTYNYAHPEGVTGYLFHTFLDVIPHLFNSEYARGVVNPETRRDE